MNGYNYGPTGGPEHGVRAAIRAELKRQGRTQAWLADQLNVSQKHVSMMLLGVNGISTSIIDRIAEVLGVAWNLAPDPSFLDDQTEQARELYRRALAAAYERGVNDAERSMRVRWARPVNPYADDTKADSDV